MVCWIDQLIANVCWMTSLAIPNGPALTLEEQENASCVCSLEIWIASYGCLQVIDAFEMLLGILIDGLSRQHQKTLTGLVGLVLGMAFATFVAKSLQQENYDPVCHVLELEIVTFCLKSLNQTTQQLVGYVLGMEIAISSAKVLQQATGDSACFVSETAIVTFSARALQEETNDRFYQFLEKAIAIFSGSFS